MKTRLLYVFLLSTVLGTWIALKNISKKGVNVVDGPEEFFLRRIDEDIRNKNATIELHLTSIDLLVTVRVDAVNKIINSATTSYLPGNVARKETEPEKESEKEQIVTTHQKNTGTSLPPPETPRVIGNLLSSLSEMAWNGLCFAMQSFYDWLTFGFGGPRHINVDRFAARSITRADLTWSAKGTVDHMFNLDISEMEKEINRVNTLTPLMTKTDMGHSDSEHEGPERLPKFPTFDYFRSDLQIQWVSPLQMENEDSILPINLGTCDLNDEDDYSYGPEHETPAEFATMGYCGMVPDITVSENNDSDNARPENNGNLTSTKDIASRDPSVVENIDNARPKSNGNLTTNAIRYKTGPENNSCSQNASRRSPESTWFTARLWNKCMAIIGWRKSSGVPLQATRVKNAAQDKWMKQLPVNVFENDMEASNKSFPETEFCTNKADTTWITTRLWNRGVAAMQWLRTNETHEKARNLTTTRDPLAEQNTDNARLKSNGNLTTNDMASRDPLVEESPSKRNSESWQLNNSEIGNSVLVDKSNCSQNASRRSSESSWFTTRLWNKCMAIIGWRKSSEPVQASRVKKSAQDKWITQVPVNVFEICMAPSNKSVPETEGKAMQGNARPKSNANLTIKAIASMDPLVEESPFKRNGESWPLKNSEIGNPVLVDEGSTSTRVDTETLLDSVDPRNQTTYHVDVQVSAVSEIQSNGTISNVCINHEIIYLGTNDMTPLMSPTRDDTRLQVTPVKKAKEKRMAKTFINESAFCLVGAKTTDGPENNFCSLNTSRRSPESTWSRLWNKCMAIIGWRESSGKPVQATRVKKAAQNKLKTQVPVNLFEKCMEAYNKSVQETEFCTEKAARRAGTTWFTTRLWNRGVAAMRWTQEKTCNLTNYYWTRFQITVTNWTSRVTFYVMIIVISLVTDYYLVKEIIRQLRLQRGIQERESEERERLRQLELEREQPGPSIRMQREIEESESEEECEWLRQLELEREQAGPSSRMQRGIEESDSEEELEVEREQAAQLSRLKHEIERELEERERLRQLEPEREQAGPSTPWRPKPRKKKRDNYCGRQQKW